MRTYYTHSILLNSPYPGDVLPISAKPFVCEDAYCECVEVIVWPRSSMAELLEILENPRRGARGSRFKSERGLQSKTKKGNKVMAKKKIAKKTAKKKTAKK